MVDLRIQPIMVMTGMPAVVGIMLTVIWVAMKMKSWTIKVKMKNAGVQSYRSESDDFTRNIPVGIK
eukprot:2106067-Amphidinium_carterae.2